MSRNSNERFLRKQFTSMKTTSHNFLVKCACVALIGCYGRDERIQKVLVNDFFVRKETKKSPETRNLDI